MPISPSEFLNTERTEAGYKLQKPPPVLIQIEVQSRIKIKFESIIISFSRMTYCHHE